MVLVNLLALAIRDPEHTPDFATDFWTYVGVVLVALLVLTTMLWLLGVLAKIGGRPAHQVEPIRQAPYHSRLPIEITDHHESLEPNVDENPFDLPILDSTNYANTVRPLPYRFYQSEATYSKSGESARELTTDELREDVGAYASIPFKTVGYVNVTYQDVGPFQPLSYPSLEESFYAAD